LYVCEPLLVTLPLVIVVDPPMLSVVRPSIVSAEVFPKSASQR
jgi:hypothetical protein